MYGSGGRRLRTSLSRQKHQNDQENPMVGTIALASILFETHITDEGLLPDLGYPNQMIW